MSDELPKVRRIAPMGGIGNRLRVVLSYREQFGPIEIWWARSPGVCGGRFEDVFEPLDGVTFIDAGDGNAQDLLPRGWAGEIGPTSSASFDAPGIWPMRYMQLRPLPHILERVAQLKAEIGAVYFAAHARHSDHDENATRFGHVTSNEEILSWYHGRGGWPLYLATECKRTEEWFAARVPHLKINIPWPRQVSQYDERPGTLSDAIVDMWMCLGAQGFRGTWISSFSETIALMRRGGVCEGGFNAERDMPSTGAEWYRGRADRAEAWIAAQQDKIVPEDP